MGLLEAPRRSTEASAATLPRIPGPRRAAAPAARSVSGAGALVGGSARSDGAGVPPNPLMQPTNAGGVGRRPHPSLRPAVRTIGFHKVVCS
jgi:hypothetical protein